MDCTVCNKPCQPAWLDDFGVCRKCRGNQRSQQRSGIEKKCFLCDHLPPADRCPTCPLGAEPHENRPQHQADNNRLPPLQTHVHHNQTCERCRKTEVTVIERSGYKPEVMCAECWRVDTIELAQRMGMQL